MNRRTPNKTETTLAFVASAAPAAVITLTVNLMKHTLPLPIQLALVAGRGVYMWFAPEVFTTVRRRLADRRNRVDSAVEEAQNILAARNS